MKGEFVLSVSEYTIQLKQFKQHLSEGSTESPKTTNPQKRDPQSIRKEIELF